MVKRATMLCGMWSTSINQRARPRAKSIRRSRPCAARLKLDVDFIQTALRIERPRVACFSDLVKSAAVLPGLQSISCRAGLAALYRPGVLANADELSIKSPPGVNRRAVALNERNRGVSYGSRGCLR